jgi:uncharacterized membrane protein YdbT with pleckstrin-like domain
MGPQLHLVTDDAATETFRADARLRLWGAAGCALAAIAFTALGYGRGGLSPVLAGPLAAAFLLWAAYLMATFAARRSVRYALTAQRLEIQSGVFSRRVESVDLFRIRDVILEQAFFERLRGAGRVTVYSTDLAEPVLHLGPLADARALFDKLRDAAAAARKDARVVSLER